MGRIQSIIGLDFEEREGGRDHGGVILNELASC